MKRIISLLIAAMLMACGKTEPVDASSGSLPAETVESLIANPERLEALRQQCKKDRAKLGDELCNRVAESTNQRFFGNGKTPYTQPKEPPKF